MGRKKKAPAPAAPEEPKREEDMMIETPRPAAFVFPEQMEEIRENAREWAVECGLQGELNVAEAVIVEYPRTGYGFSVQVQEKAGKCRMATARFTSEGLRSYWSMDGKVVI